MSTERAIYALAEFTASMEMYEVKPYLERTVQICLAYLNGQGQKRGVRYQSLNALSAIITAGEESIMPMRDTLLQTFYGIVKNTTAPTEQAVKGKALLCAGSLASACGKENFPQEALEEFTKFGLECIQQQDAKLELRETSISYFSDISKILKSQFAPILDSVLQPILEVIKADDGLVEKVRDKEKQGFSLDSDSEDEEVVGIDLDSNFLDEKAASIHALGNICLNCAGIMQPHMETVMEVLKGVEMYFHENIRFHVCQAYT